MATCHKTIEIMEKSRFNELMVQHPNWVTQGDQDEVFTFFDGHYTHGSSEFTPKESDRYRLEDDGETLKIEFAATGKRYLLNESSSEGFPVLELMPIDSSGDEYIALIPNV